MASIIADSNVRMRSEFLYRLILTLIAKGNRMWAISDRVLFAVGEAFTEFCTICYAHDVPNPSYYRYNLVHYEKMAKPDAWHCNQRDLLDLRPEWRPIGQSLERVSARTLHLCLSGGFFPADRPAMSWLTLAGIGRSAHDRYTRSAYHQRRLSIQYAAALPDG